MISLKQEVVAKVAPIFEAFKNNVEVAGMNAVAAMKAYTILAICEVVAEVEAQANETLDASSDKKQAAMEAMGVFFDVVLGPLVPLGLKTAAKKAFLLVVGVLIDSFVAWVNKKLAGNFAAL